MEKKTNSQLIEMNFTVEGFVAIVNEKLMSRSYGPNYTEYFEWVTLVRVVMTRNGKWYDFSPTAELQMPYGMFHTRKECEDGIAEYIRSLNTSLEKNNAIKAKHGLPEDKPFTKEDILIDIVKVRYVQKCEIVG